MGECLFGLVDKHLSQTAFAISSASQTPGAARGSIPEETSDQIIITMGFVGVCTAIYDYQPQAEGELEIRENDLLYILDKDDDDWWKAKKKADLEDEEPVGLVPNNYVQEVRGVLFLFVPSKSMRISPLGLNHLFSLMIMLHIECE